MGKRTYLGNEVIAYQVDQHGLRLSIDVKYGVQVIGTTWVYLPWTDWETERERLGLEDEDEAQYEMF